MEDVDSETLIPLVEARPALYDKNLKEYSDRNIKQELWLEICGIMVTDWLQLSAEEKTQVGVKIQKRWQSLRTAFKKEYNAQRDNRSGKAGKKRKKYEFYSQLRFLLPTLSDRSITSSDIVPPDEAQATSVTATTNLHESTSTVPLKNIPFPHAQPSVVRNKKKTVSNKSYEERLLNILEEKGKETIDEDKSFLLSLVPSFKRMSNQQKLKTKMRFLQILSDIESTSPGSPQSPNSYSEENYNEIYVPEASEQMKTSPISIKEEILDLGL